MKVTLYHLHGSRGSHSTVNSATRARKYLADGRKHRFGRYVIVVTYDNGKPVHVRTYQ